MKTKEELIKTVMNSNIEEDSKIDLILMISKEIVHVPYTIPWYPQPTITPSYIIEPIYDIPVVTC